MNKDNGGDLAEAVDRGTHAAEIPPADRAKLLPPSDAELTADRLEELLAGKGEGIKTRFPLLDNLTGGLAGIVTLTGPPGCGKSTLAQTIALAVSDANDPVLYYSLEMPAEKMLERAIVAHAGGRNWKTLRTLREELDVVAAKVKHRSRNLHTIDRKAGAVTPAVIRAHVEETVNARHGKPPLVVIDHGRYVKMPDHEGAPEYERDQAFYAAVQALSQETGAAMLLILEQSKAEFGTGKMQSGKGTVSSAYDAETVLVIWSAEFKDQGDDAGAIPEYTGPAEAIDAASRDLWLLVQKNRNGPSPRKIRYTFHGPEYRFKEQTEQQRQRQEEEEEARPRP